MIFRLVNGKMVRLSPSEEDALQGTPPEFDLEAAREQCDGMRAAREKEYHATYEAYAKGAGEMLPAALDEIERLHEKQAMSDEWYAVRIRILEDYFRTYGKDLPIAETFWNILANERGIPTEPPTYRHILFEKDRQIEAQAKRIAELERDNQKWREYNQELYQKNQKLEAALAEERAKIIRLDENCPEGGCYSWCDLIYDSDRQKARQQLRAEGLL